MTVAGSVSAGLISGLDQKSIQYTMVVGLMSVLERMEKGCRVARAAGSWSKTHVECETQRKDGYNCHSAINMADGETQKKKVVYTYGRYNRSPSV